MGEEKLLRGSRQDQNDGFQRRMNLEIRRVEREGDFAEKAWRCDVKALENCEFSLRATIPTFIYGNVVFKEKFLLFL